MGLFSKKKQTELPRLPRLPDIPDLDFDSSHDLPAYEEQKKDIRNKRAIEKIFKTNKIDIIVHQELKMLDLFL